MDDPNITMEEYIRLEEKKARKRNKVFNWETAKYGKIWYDEDVHNLRSVETEFSAIVFNDTLMSEPTRIQVSIRRILGNGYDVSTSCTVLEPHEGKSTNVGEVSIIWNPMCDCRHASIQTHLQHNLAKKLNMENLPSKY
ncbi:hypothetical protein Tco_0880638 [Tanacetum coccineum]